MSASMVLLIVVLQARPYQIDTGHAATAWPMNAAAPAIWNTRRYCVPGGSAAPATYAARMLTTTQNTNHCTRLRFIVIGPFGITVKTITGPCSIFSAYSGVLQSAMLVGRGTT